MTHITFVTPTGERIDVDVDAGSVMRAAVVNDVRGIDGDCGGVCSCATCHVRFDPAWFEVVGPPGDIEQDMLELDEHATAYSRLSCQIDVTAELNGLVAYVVAR